MLYIGWLNWELVYLNVKVLSSLAPRRFLPFKMILKIWSYTEGRLYAIEIFHYSKCNLPWLRELKYLTNDKLKPAKITYTQFVIGVYFWFLLIINADVGFSFAINVEDHSISVLVSTSAVEMFFAIYLFLWCCWLSATSYILKYIQSHQEKGRLTVALAMSR